MRPTHLHTRRPSPTTVEYTVSDLTPRSTLSAYTIFGTQLLLRLIAGFALVAVNLSKWNTRLPASFPPVGVLLGTRLGWLADRAASYVEWWVLLIITAVVGNLIVRRGYTEESLLVLRGLGIQTSTTASTYLSPCTTRFIPTTQIQDIFIHEAFRGFEVRFYLAVVVEGEEAVVVVFPKLLPRRDMLEQIWRGARECLYGPKT